MKRQLRAVLLVSSVLGFIGLLFAQSVNATGTWLATGVPYEPWTFQLKQDGTKLTGTIEQNGALRGPVDIYEGTLNGAAISFKAKSPDGARAITFTGTIKGDEITLNRLTEIITNASPGGTGLFGTNAAPQFTIRRGAAGGAGAATAPVSGQVTGPAGRWRVTAVPNAPWTFEFAVVGEALTGTVQQGGTASMPVSITGGKASETTVSFKVLSPDGERIITFSGRVSGNEISFVRQITALVDGSRGGNDLYGGSAPLQFVASRVASR
jgi:hypothetical protein